MAERRTIKVDYLARVEGEGALDVRVRDGEVERVQLAIFEPPRFFEALLRGRRFGEAVDITARICGICPVAYQMSACHAMEDACGVRVDGPLRALRRLLYCGEWIESHVLHIAMLHAPDFYGVPSVVELAKREPQLVETALRLKKAGNAIVSRLGGREIHPINVRVGGFYRVPRPSEFRELREELAWARDAAEELVRWVAALDFPDLERDYLLVALRHEEEYPFNEGRVVSNRGLDIDVHEYDHHFREEHVAHSTALQSRLDGEAYMTGPMARFALNFDRLDPAVRDLAGSVGIGPDCRNPFKSIVIRALEVVHACGEALRVLDAFDAVAEPTVAVAPRAGWGRAATEAPRGLLFHRYRIDDEGLIESATIVPPTSQNQPAIEEDVATVVRQHIAEDDDALRGRCERAIRNYDPCISCSTHFLDLRVDRG